jgi:flagellar hook-basal body complex protein FliE
MTINDALPVRAPADLEGPGAAGKAGATEGGGFAGVLKDSISEVNRLQQKADASISALATTGEASLHDTMIAMEEASVSFKLMMQVRNKIVEAYQEVMRIQV